ncbi:hypothetical protein AB8P51_15095 [Muriicola sp. SD30]|uniref:Uncharacterized protein n=1 Tax=Arenibacter algicola TaxID=616991 RepID=A0A221UW22_9FLAO|nr:hypothetical protein [Arenibacter algicola]ASO05440.1 hypothetical protein AREALGSMS7_01980 [Arenibacter algicola]ASO05442.1 hypothetical protein AREALGSMS7_01982 [Arenibacter algicola]
MKYKMLVFTLSLSCLLSCQTNKTVKKDLVTGLISQGNGISCQEVNLSDGNSSLQRNTFVYGEKFHLNFNNISGFKKVNNLVFPGMELLVTGQKGDTIMHNPDLYGDGSSGIDISPLLLQAKITAANPIHSNGTYTLNVNIWDKKSKGTFKSEIDFTVTPNKHLEIENNSVLYDEIYLFSKERNSVITDNQAKFNENIYMIFEGLEGFKIEDGKANLGLSIMGTDSKGEIILNEVDLVGDSTIEVNELKNRLSPNFIFSGSNIENPVTCEITIWDKKSESRIKATVELSIK